ncbi:MarR family winged helix-turn-helix transcriptional regulator [Paraburkholderia caribensis]|uniref:MarR family winged helix-turn-helix transcriptional regulator n=1 Tax=Paraburkholderia caribensis TaxID=75105 RepID=UPI0034D330BB
MSGRGSNEGVNRSNCSSTTLRKASRRLSLLYDAALAPCGLKTTQRAILAQIRRSEPASVGSLADALVMDSGALAHTLKPLERDGFIVHHINPEDRRQRLIKLTARGRSKLEESDTLWVQAQDAFDLALGKTESAMLRKALQSVLSDELAENFKRSLVNQNGFRTG